MSFTFNWSPLIADTSRAREMLTTALNKSPKPPIIVDDVHVTELNLGSTPPALEILEIGDLAEDRFRGIFKMVYSGDAFLTLKTRVQANPLNTYLSTKRSFASPQPLAAASGLTIPLQITLSEIRLSGFVILVFSKQKGITLVFRNDPLEGLRVSSTFDSIPFVRDYLQNEIEKQLRLLFMEDLPAIIHRLSLRLLVPPDHQAPSTAAENTNLNSNSRLDPEQNQPIDPLSSPPQNPTDASDDVEHAPLDGEQYSFSRKNLLRLAALNDSHRTLSLFTPPLRDAVVRAWAGSAEQGREAHAPLVGHTIRPSGLTLASLRSTTAPSLRSAPSSTSADDVSLPSASALSRPTLSTQATSHSYSLSGTATSSASRQRTRKRKHRVVNLRRKTEPVDGADAESTTPSSHGGSDERPTTPTSNAPPESSSWRTTSSREEDELVTPPDSPERSQHKNEERTPHASRQLERTQILEQQGGETIKPVRRVSEELQHRLQMPVGEKVALDERRDLASATSRLESPFINFAGSAQPGGILEQAWLMKMAAEIARKAEDERRRQNEVFWARSPAKEGLESRSGRSSMDDPPPAYGY